MNPIYLMLAVAVIAAVLGVVRTIVVSRADKKTDTVDMDRKATEDYTAKCNDGEVLKVVCRAHYSKPWYYVLTSERLIIDIPGKQCTEIRLSDITKIKAEDLTRNPYGSKKTDSPSTCTQLTIWTGNKKYILMRFSEKFTDLAKAFIHADDKAKTEERGNKQSADLFRNIWE